MAQATLSRDGTSVTLDLIETGGTPVISADLGKPNLNEQPSGALEPRHIDQFAGTESYTLLGRFVGSNAYTKAITLGELIKSNMAGNDLVLDVDLDEIPSNVTVAPAPTEESVNMAYVPGNKNRVDVEMQLTRYGELQGSYDLAEQQETTPTTTGTGPIQISDGVNTVDLTRGIEVSRSVGRPNSTVRTQRNTQFPAYVDNAKAAYDAFELNLEFGDNTLSKIADLRPMFNTRLRRESLTLDFNGLYGYGSFSVIPTGGQAIRHTRQAGEQGIVLVPTINLRRVL